MQVQYPLQLTFKLAAFAPQIRVTDANGALVFYVKQKLFKLKEAVGVFADEAQTQKLYEINADRVIDFSARYNFKDGATGHSLGAVKRQGMRSLFKAHFDVFQDGSETPALTIQETNPWTKFFDALFSQIPLLGMFSGYVFHPIYQVARADGAAVMTLKKEPAFFEGKFSIIKHAETEASEERRILLSLLMMVLLERSRG